MYRRELLRTVGGVCATVSLAGCIGGFLGGGSNPPPQRFEAFEDVTVDDGTLQARLEPEPAAETRAKVSAPPASPSLGGGEAVLPDVADAVGSVSPVGVASAQKGGGRGGGATGRGTGGYRGAPRGNNGHAIYHGDDDDDDWRENHDDEIGYYRAAIDRVGIARLGVRGGDDLPGPGPVNWDRTIDDVSGGDTVTYDVSRGWYRLGSRLVAVDDDHEFGWMSLDVEVEPGSNSTIEESWKVAPRL